MVRRVGLSEGAVRMKAALVDRGWTQNELARRLGTSSGLMSRWLNGDRTPDRSSAVQIEKLLGIKPELFDRLPGIRAAS